MQKIIRLKEVETICGIARSTIYLAISRGEFPKQVQLGRRSVGWILNEVDGWVKEKIQKSRAQSKGGNK